MSKPKQNNAIKPSRAQAFWDRQNAGSTAVTTPYGIIYEINNTPYDKLAAAKKCIVDDFLQEAIDRGFLDGTVESLRNNLLLNVVIGADASAGAIY